MVMVAPRDYYADLELPPSADVQEVKKQYRKLGNDYSFDIPICRTLG